QAVRGHRAERREDHRAAHPRRRGRPHRQHPLRHRRPPRRLRHPYGGGGPLRALPDHRAGARRRRAGHRRPAPGRGGRPIAPGTRGTSDRGPRLAASRGTPSTRCPPPHEDTGTHSTMYDLFFRLFFQRMDPERAHHLAFRWIRRVASVPVLRTFVAAVLAPRHRELRTEALGLRLHSPLGLAAGFDKNAVGIDGLAMTGFDHVEIGTVTGEPQPGNPKKRLFRLVEDRALINRMGFNNDGSLRVAARLAARRPVFRTVVGVNIGKTKAVPEEQAVADYVKSAERLAPYADYLVVNVSSPNTPGLRNLQAVDQLRPLLTAVREAADRSVPGRRVPLLVKIAPDLADEDIDAVADLAVDLGLDGIIATNTTIAREGL